MYFHHLHFYVKDTAFWTQWFEHKLSFQRINLSTAPTQHLSEQARCEQTRCEQTRCEPVILTQGSIEIRLSSPQHQPAVATYLSHHPPGLADIALATNDLTATLHRAQRQGATVLLQPIHTNRVGQRQCQIQGWADLRHTLIEVDTCRGNSQAHNQIQYHQPGAAPPLVSLIDHVVINVPKGDLQAAVAWYQKIFGCQLGQSFEISTANSGLCSQVLTHPEGPLQLPINEPSSKNSQIQEFLNHNRGAGVQHVALRAPDAIEAIAQFRHQGLDLLQVPNTYYEDLNQRSDRPIQDLSAISRQQLLLDWAQGGQAGMLLQTFTQPIFSEPTFFFEVIERSDYYENGQTKTAEGFGEGNFQALFEAIERAQIKRGSLQT
ncbi:MAG: 4-hydroxyphenylpyruvate dioxygenase [Cyanobacteria bacterium J06648_10]